MSCALVLSLVFGAPGLAADFPPQWATRGAPIRATLRVRDDIGVVDRVRFTLTTERGVRFTATSTRAQPGDVFRGTFTESVWVEDPSTLTITAEAIGRRGGLVLFVGPMSYDILTPQASAARLRATATPERRTELGATVGLLTRIGTPARGRAFVRVHGPVAPGWELGVTTSVGPTFAVPDRLEGTGAIGFGAELDARRAAGRRGFVTAFAGIDARFSGVDPLVGVGAGARWGRAIAFEVQLDGSAMLFD